jgi:hypothetical protein
MWDGVWLKPYHVVDFTIVSDEMHHTILLQNNKYGCTPFGLLQFTSNLVE